jgi:hypothetical protein
MLAVFVKAARLVDVGGYRLMLDCTGRGNPAVMLDSVTVSIEWRTVQPEIAKFFRV